MSVRSSDVLPVLVWPTTATLSGTGVCAEEAAFIAPPPGPSPYQTDDEADQATPAPPAANQAPDRFQDQQLQHQARALCRLHCAPAIPAAWQKAQQLAPHRSWLQPYRL